MAYSMAHLNIDDDDLETFSIFWLDVSVNNAENVRAQKQLRSIINQVKTFEDPGKLVDRIHRIAQGDRTVLIVSGQLGRIVVPEIHRLRSVSSIYVYCRNKAANEQWSRTYSKVEAVCVKLDELINRIRLDQKRRIRIEEPLSLNILDRSSTGFNGQFLHAQLLIDVLVRMKPKETDRRELIALCKENYKHNDVHLKVIEEFAREYRASKAVWWYTRESFLYPMLNKALRIQNVDVLYLFRSVIRDIREQLSGRQCQHKIRVYRGQKMSCEEMDVLRASIGEFISMNSLLSTTLNLNQALAFCASQSTSSTAAEGLEVVLFEIEADPQMIIGDGMNVNMRPFANITDMSAYGDEAEVLFMLGSIFRLNQICHDQSSADARMSIIRMTLCSDHDKDLKQLYDHMKKEYHREETNLLSLGNVLLDMGKFDLAEKYYRRLLSELPSNDPSLSDLYQNIGMVANAKGDYETSLEWYQKSLEIDMRTRPSDHVNIGMIHNSIGAVHRKKGDHSRALESYNRAVSLFQKAHHENHPYMALFYDNIGISYEEQKKYSEALDFYEKSLAIKRKHLPINHPELGGSYNNIGIVHDCLGHYDLALEHYNRSLEIKLKSLPAQHPVIAGTYKNMGILYEHKDELEQALTSLQKASTIYHHALSNQHPDCVKIDNDVNRVKDKLKKKKTKK